MECPAWLPVGIFLDDNGMDAGGSTEDDEDRCRVLVPSEMAGISLTSVL